MSWTQTYRNYGDKSGTIYTLIQLQKYVGGN